jgi:hypothetical protein
MVESDRASSKPRHNRLGRVKAVPSRLGATSIFSKVPEIRHQKSSVLCMLTHVLFPRSSLRYMNTKCFLGSFLFLICTFVYVLSLCMTSLLLPSLGVVPRRKHIWNTVRSMLWQLFGNQLHQFPVDDLVSFGVQVKAIMKHCCKCLVLLNLT